MKKDILFSKLIGFLSEGRLFHLVDFHKKTCTYYIHGPIGKSIGFPIRPKYSKEQLQSIITKIEMPFSLLRLYLEIL